MVEVEDDGDGEVVGHGEGPEDAVAGLELKAAIGGEDAGGEGFVGKNNPFRSAGGAGAEADGGGVEGLEFRDGIGGAFIGVVDEVGSAGEGEV